MSARVMRVIKPATVTEHEYEPVDGLPQELPAGETVLWRGAPQWRVLARHGFRLRGLALYFAALAALQVAVLASDGAAPSALLVGAVWPLLLGLVPIGLLALFAVLVARTTAYTLTNRRVVLRVGVALPITINLPFAAVEAAALRRLPGGAGDVVLTLAAPHRASYVVLWPHARPWRLSRPEPMLRGIADAEVVAQHLARALASASGMPVPSAPADTASATRPGVLAGAAVA